MGEDDEAAHRHSARVYREQVNSFSWRSRKLKSVLCHLENYLKKLNPFVTTMVLKIIRYILMLKSSRVDDGDQIISSTLEFVLMRNCHLPLY